LRVATADSRRLSDYISARRPAPAALCGRPVFRRAVSTPDDATPNDVSANLPMIDEHEKRLKRLRHRSHYTGTKETDIILGGFAEAHLDGLTPAQIDAFEALVETPEPDVYMWISGRSPVPAEFDTDVMAMLKNFRIEP
jgi:antitoxin CptB